jgi:hypothetical protein
MDVRTLSPTDLCSKCKDPLLLHEWWPLDPERTALICIACGIRPAKGRCAYAVLVATA